MVDKVTNTYDSTQDRVKISLAILSLIGGVVLFYSLDVDMLFYRVISVIGMTIVAAMFFFMTATGSDVANFLRGSRIELQKMVWPTRKETIYSTMVVFIALFFTALFLWALDLSLAWAMQLIIQ